MEDSQSVPLVVDVDGTLLDTDLLFESAFHCLATHPLSVALFPFWLTQGKAVLKANIAARADLDCTNLPFNPAMLDFIEAEQKKGRQIHLASASDRKYVETLAEVIPGISGVFASDGVVNLSGEAKAAALCDAFGQQGFDYAGNAKTDQAVWARARIPIVVNAPPQLTKRMRAERAETIEIPAHRRLDPRTFMRALRTHQWPKNLLLFIPMLAAHDLSSSNLIQAVLAFLAFSFCASSVYLLNDLLDLPHDRNHATKRNRPLASGALPIQLGLALIPLLLTCAIALSILLTPLFGLILAIYVVLSLTYSMVLKRKMLVDIVVLSLLYTLRVIAGGVAVQVSVSAWLLAFSMFFFLSLAIVKRYTELMDGVRSAQPAPSGRGYLEEDLPVLSALAGASGYSAVLVLALYINSPKTQELYSQPEILWFICPLTLYWISRAILLAHRGNMHEDPVVFAFKDRTSWVIYGLVALLIVAGAGL